MLYVLFASQGCANRLPASKMRSRALRDLAGSLISIEPLLSCQSKVLQCGPTCRALIHTKSVAWPSPHSKRRMDAAITSIQQAVNHECSSSAGVAFLLLIMGGCEAWERPENSFQGEKRGTGDAADTGFLRRSSVHFLGLQLQPAKVRRVWFATVLRQDDDQN